MLYIKILYIKNNFLNIIMSFAQHKEYMKEVKKAVIPAAGFGTRFLPATKAIPKEMFPIVDTPTIQHIVEEAVASGITEILIILGRNKKSIEDHFDYSPELDELLLKTKKDEIYSSLRKLSDSVHIYYARQKEMKGSGNALLEAEAFVGSDPFAVLFGDDVVYNPTNPCTKQLIDAYYTTGKTIVGCQHVAKEEAVKYGIVDIGNVKGRYYELKGIVEKPSINALPSTLANLGRFVLTPDIFSLIKKTKPASNGEVYLTDALQLLAQSVGVFAYDFEGRRYDIGDKVGYIEASIEYGLRDKTISGKIKEYLSTLVKTF